MENQNIQNQINEINQKLDLVLHYVNEQRLRGEVVDDLISDVSIIGKDAFQTAVSELDQQGIELDVDEIKKLIFKVIRNISNFSSVLDMFESATDFLKDTSPIAREVIIDFINKLYDFEKKGYFEYINVFGNMLGKVHENYTIDDFRSFTNNMPVLIQIFKNATQADTLKSLENITTSMNLIKPDQKLDNKSLFKLFRELKSPEVRQTISYLLRIVKSINIQEKNK